MFLNNLKNIERGGGGGGGANDQILNKHRGKWPGPAHDRRVL